MRLAGVLRSLLPENGKLFTLYAKMIQRQRLRNLERFANSEAGSLVLQLVRVKIVNPVDFGLFQPDFYSFSTFFVYSTFLEPFWLFHTFY